MLPSTPARCGQRLIVHCSLCLQAQALVLVLVLVRVLELVLVLLLLLELVMVQQEWKKALGRLQTCNLKSWRL